MDINLIGNTFVLPLSYFVGSFFFFFPLNCEKGLFPFGFDQVCLRIILTEAGLACELSWDCGVTII